MKKLLSALFLLLNITIVLPLKAQTSTLDSHWEYYPSYYNATQSVAVGNVVYALFSGNLLIYDTEDHTVYTIDRLSYNLSDNTISKIAWSDTQKCLVALYDNNNIDLIYPQNGDISTATFEVVNIPQVKKYTETQVKINNLNVSGDWACMGTTDGVILLNLKQQNIRGYYQLGTNVDDAIVIGKRIYASFNNSIMSGALYGNLYDISQWKVATSNIYVSRFVGSNIGAYLIVPYRAALSNASEAGIWRMITNDDNTVSTKKVHGWPVVENGSANGKYVQFSNQNVVVTINTNNPDSPEHVLSNTNLMPNAITRTTDGTLYMALAYNGLKSYNFSSDGSSLSSTETIGKIGPRHVGSYSLQINNGRLFVTGGEFDDYPHDGFVGYYDGTKWNDMDEDNAMTVPSKDGRQGQLFVNLNHVAIDPRDPSHVMVASYGEGLYEYKYDKFVKLYNTDNSPLQYPTVVGTASRNNYVRVGGCTYDNEGNLWMTANYNDTLLTIIRTDGSWKRIRFAALDEYTRAEKIMFDHKGRLWCNIRLSADGKSSGLAGLDYNGTINTDRDDKSYLRTSATNEDGTSCSLEGLKTMIEDRNGQIWIGCTSGVYAITDPDEWFTSSFNIYQPKVPRNDGTNYADYLLTGTEVSAIAVDAGNRKWIGTTGAGIYLVNEDGSEILQHFTSSDSPLLSDNIFDLAIDSVSGKMFIATDCGLCSYKTDVTTALPTLNKDNIHVYPNPVKVEYKGNVNITGLTLGSEVKVLSTGGQLVARGNAIGGSWQWNLCHTTNGERVAPGVYFIVIATADGKQSVAAKVAVM